MFTFGYLYNVVILCMIILLGWLFHRFCSDVKYTLSTVANDVRMYYVVINICRFDTL